MLVNESLSTQPVFHHYVPTAHPDSYYAMTSGALGFGLPAAVGVALAEQHLNGSRKVIAVIGDGAANYTIQALWTAAQHNANILFIIVRNHAYNILKSFGKYLDTPNCPGLDLPDIDFIGLATGYGLSADRITDPAQLDAVLLECVSNPGPHLLEIITDATVPDLIS